MSENQFIMAATTLVQDRHDSTDIAIRITVGHETHTVSLWRSRPEDLEELKKMGVPVVEY